MLLCNSLRLSISSLPHNKRIQNREYKRKETLLKTHTQKLNINIHKLVVILNTLCQGNLVIYMVNHLSVFIVQRFVKIIFIALSQVQ